MLRARMTRRPKKAVAKRTAAKRAVAQQTAARLQRFGALGLACAAAAAFAWHCATSPEVTWIEQSGDAAWITDPRPVDLMVQQFGREEVPVATFARRFELDAPPVRAELRVRAARAYRVRVNGTLAWASPDPDPRWRAERAQDVAPLLRAGDNEVAIDVWNPRGPPLLQARLVLPDRVIPTGVDWTAAAESGAPAPAVLPDDTRAPASAATGPRPARALAEHAGPLAGLLALALLAWVLLGERIGALSAWLPRLALLLVHGIWLALFAFKFSRIPLTAGFDASNHLHYVELLRSTHALPLPSDGWSTFHPPLFYALVAVLAGLGPAWGAIAAKTVSFAAGLGQVWIALGLARVLLPDRPGSAAVAVLFAGFLPLNLYSAAYLSNEPLHAFWFGLAALLTARALARCRVRTGDALAIGIVLGLALLTKLTAVVAAGVSGGCILARAAVVERARPPRLAALAAALALPPAALAGWFYARNVRLYGTPFVGNWNLPGMRWWSQPGFHTAAYYLGFGESLRLPVLSGFHSLADALYSSFWGDGWIAGRASAAWLPEFWSWPWVAIGYWLAVPVTLVLAAGALQSLRRAFAPEGPLRAAWSFVVALEVALVLALVWLTLELPYFGQAKAPYLLGLVAPLAATFALGAETCDALLRRAGGRAASILGRALLTTAGAVFVLSFAA